MSLQNTGRLGIGAAGLGQAGAMMLPAIQRHGLAFLAAAADPDEASRQAFADRHVAPVYASLKELCADPRVAAVYIATPTQLHAEHTLQAIAAGKHVIVEKPMALTLEASTHMIEAAEQAGVQLIVGHSQSFEPPIRKMRHLVASSDLGDLAMINTWYYTDWLYRPRRPEELDTALGGGVLMRQGAHQVGLIRWIAGGLATSVRASTTRADPGRPGIGGHVMFLEFESGAAATAVFSGYDHFNSRELTGGIGEDGRRASAHPGAARAALRSWPEEGLKAMLGVRSLAEQPAREHASSYGLTVVSCARGDIRQSPGGLEVFGDDGVSDVAVPPSPTGRDLLLDELCEAVLDGVPPAHDGPWGRANLEVCLAALESATTRREVNLRFQVPTSRPAEPRAHGGSAAS